MRIPGAGLGRAGCLSLAVFVLAAASASAADYFPNVDTDGTHAASSCLAGSPDPCSLRDAVVLKAADLGVAATVHLTSGHTYHVTTGPLLTGGDVGNTAHDVEIDGAGATIDLSGIGGNDGIVGGGSVGSPRGLDLEDVTIHGAPQDAAVVFDGPGNLTVNNTTFSGNTSTNGGPAALDVREATVATISQTLFTGNHGASAAGAEIDGVTGSTTLTRVGFTGNQGDALEIGLSGPNLGPVSLDGVSFRQNFGPGYVGVLSFNAGGAGGSLHNVDVEGNTVDQFGRGVVSLLGSFTKLDNVTIAGNTSAAGTAGGAKLALTGTATANNWTVAGNQVTSSTATPAVAGGIEVSSGTLRLNHGTIANNSAGGNADDLHTSGTGAIVALNSIVAGSSAGGAVPCASDGGTISSAGHNIDLGGSCHFTAAGDLSHTDPRLGSLTPEGDLTTPGNLSFLPLLYGSPAVDAADSANCLPATDARAVTRPQGVACDIGAVESQLVDLSVAGSASPGSLPAGGGQVTYTFDVSNGSGANPQGVSFINTLPTGATFVSASASQGTCSPRTQVVCALGVVHRGADVTVTVVANLTATGANADRAHVESELPDSNMTNDTTQLTVNIPAPGGGGGSAAPKLTGLKLTPRSFHPLGTVRRHPRAGGTRVSYLDSVAGATTLTILRSASGARVRGRCVAPPRHAQRGHRPPSCRRTLVLGAFHHTDTAGRVSISFSGRIGRRPLAPGTYALRAATSFHRRISPSVTSTFAILR